MSNSMHKTFYSTLLLALALAAAGRANAQADSVAIMRRFLQVCNDYKQLPIQLDLDVRNSSNIVLSGNDTGDQKIGFYLSREGSYIAMGGVEQLANDSLLLLVNKATKRMILMANHQSIAARLKETMGMQMQDSSVDLLAARYTATEPPPVKDTAAIELKSRALLYHTQLPREEITIRYHAATKQPAEVITTKRSLLSVSDSVYREVSGRAEWAGKTVSVHDSSFYLLKEQVVVFRYRKITHEQTDGLPVRISDRLIAEGRGNYRPVGSYADFVLSRQF